MHTVLSPADLNDDDLLHEAARLVRAAHEATAALVRVLMEVDRRRLYLRDGCSSLFVWCVQVLHLDEGAAYNRIEVARAARRHPAVIDALHHGGVSLTAARLLAPHLTASNHVDVLARASGRTTRAIHLLVAELAPRPAVPSSIRRLPSASGPPAGLGVATPPRPSSELAPLLDEASPVSGPAPERALIESESTPGSRPGSGSGPERGNTHGADALAVGAASQAAERRQTGPGTGSSSPTAAGAVAEGTAAGAVSEVGAGAVSEVGAGSVSGAVSGAVSARGVATGATGDGTGAVTAAEAAAVTEARGSVAGAGTTERGVTTGAIAPRTEAQAVVVPLSPVHFKLQMTITSETHAKLRHAQNLLRHTMPGGDLADIVDRALTVLVRELERQRWARTRTLESAERHTHRISGRPSARSRHIPSFVRRAVWQRDEGRCALVGPHGRCHERAWLEFHHVRPFGAGGLASVENISLRCRAHNAYEGAVLFGKDSQPRRRKVSDTTE